MDTLALDLKLWDLTVDAYGNWASVGDATPSSPNTGPGMRLAQDVATQCQTWLGEAYYDTTQGINYSGILGRAPNLAFIQNTFNEQALLVPGCATAIANFTFTPGPTRAVRGTISVSDQNGNVGTVQL